MLTLQSYIQFDVRTGILTRCNSYDWLVQQSAREGSVHLSIPQICLTYDIRTVSYCFPSVMIRTVSVETKRYTGLVSPYSRSQQTLTFYIEMHCVELKSPVAAYVNYTGYPNILTTSKKPYMKN